MILSVALHRATANLPSPLAYADAFDDEELRIRAGAADNEIDDGDTASDRFFAEYGCDLVCADAAEPDSGGETCAVRATKALSEALMHLVIDLLHAMLSRNGRYLLHIFVELDFRLRLGQGRPPEGGVQTVYERHAAMRAGLLDDQHDGQAGNDDDDDSNAGDGDHGDHGLRQRDVDERDDGIG